MPQDPAAVAAPTQDTQAPRRTRCDVYSRVVGYLRPTSHWNVGKRAEWAQRKNFDLPTLE